MLKLLLRRTAKLLMNNTAIKNKVKAKARKIFFVFTIAIKNNNRHNKSTFGKSKYLMVNQSNLYIKEQTLTDHNVIKFITKFLLITQNQLTSSGCGYYTG